MPSSHSPQRLTVTFDDDHAVAGAGLSLVGVLSEKLGLVETAEELIEVSPFPGKRVATLVHAVVAGPTASTTPTCSARGRPPRCSATR